MGIRLSAIRVRRDFMKARRIGRGVLTAVGVGFLVLSWSQAARAQVKLEYKFPEGKKLTYKTTMNIHQVITLMGMEIPSNDRRTTVVSRSIGERGADSSLPVEEKVESLHVDLRLPGGIDLTYDSKDPNAKIDNPQLAFLGDVFKLVSEISYTVVLDAQNKVKAVEGTEKIMEKAEKLDDLVRDSIRGAVNPDKTKARFEQEHRNLPDVLARPGEPWERTETMDTGGQTFTFLKKYEYVGTEKKGDKTLDKISSKVLDVKYSQDPDSKSPLKVTKSDLKVESSEGTVLFDREQGCVVESRGKTQIKGSMTFSAGGQDLPGQLELSMQVGVQLQPSEK
jgi:hypothetical protein